MYTVADVDLLRFTAPMKFLELLYLKFRDVPLCRTTSSFISNELANAKFGLNTQLG